MPSLTQILENKEKKQFKKKSYRPWNLTGGDSLSDESNNFSNIATLPSNNEENIISIEDFKQADLSTENVTFLDNNQITITEKTDTQSDSKEVTNREQISNKSDNDGNNSDNKEATKR